MRLKKGPSHSFQPPTAIRSSQGSSVYTFTDGSPDLGSSSEEEIDIMELRARGGELLRQNASREKVGDVILLECAITENDNLNKLALQYGCKVADIKRVNNFLTEQDMYALKIIKIPVKVHGIFTELHAASYTQKGQAVYSEDIVSDPASPTENTDITRYFQEIDQDIEAAAQTQDLLSESLDPGTDTFQISPRKNSFSLGADCGIRWWNAVVIMLLIGIVLPVFYILYYETRKVPEQLQVSANVTNTFMPKVSTKVVNRIMRNLHDS
ncbi:lysM and putative peptidoglycan-binding domain-containing protein 4 [Pseudophryne corroboree]|uniref:lysM and putative peptidoglycan-binding domain-containing protein 4 n=1 Tax=Pseudophryne corroboree TaxID=495146 RepID=UPI003081F177